MIPTATYRLQFHQNFTFRDALALVPYLADLGISSLYASPFFKSAPGSTHGYDVCDHNAFDSEIGSEQDFEALSAALTQHGMHMVVDFVPNHMGITGMENRWWADVLENGANSIYARYFDIDWHPLKHELHNKVLLPILGDQYGRILEKGELHVEWNAGAFTLNYYQNRLPLTPSSTLPILENAVAKTDMPVNEKRSLLDGLDRGYRMTGAMPAEERQALKDLLVSLTSSGSQLAQAIDTELRTLNADFDRLDALIGPQHYRLSFWKVASEEINYRRFFDINDLAALRMELPEVFNDTHRLLFDLAARGVVTGVRIDHIDGLADPRSYLTQLQSELAKLLGKTDGDKAIYLLVEKILGHTEQLRPDWPVHGTTGYEFAARTTALLVDPSAEKRLTEGYHDIIGDEWNYREMVYRNKKLVMQVSLSSEVNNLGYILNRISESNRWYRDFTVNALTIALREVIACFPVYRTYLIPDTPPDDLDRRIILRAIAFARRRNPALERTVFEFIRDVLLPPDPNLHPVDPELRKQFILKLQQCTGPIMAKGVEDTTFYVYNRFIALNEVGGEPDVFGMSIEKFHEANIRRLAEFPHSMLTTSTHDTKRSEDVRARLAVLSEIPYKWLAAVRKWRKLNRKLRREIDGEMAPDPNEEYLIYQTLAGSWPSHPMDDEEHATYISRIQEYMLKALHEAKTHSSWIEPHEQWDQAVLEFVKQLLVREPQNQFLPQFQAFVETTLFPGAVNALAQLTLKLTVPGMPDIYQGTELWDWSLVDPDNRRPVDYPLRTELLRTLDNVSIPDLLAHWRDGRIKLHVTKTLLHLRKNHTQLFQEGNYEALKAKGLHSQNLIAFQREYEGITLLVVVPRLAIKAGFNPPAERWGDTAVSGLDKNTRWRNVFTQNTLGGSETIRARALFDGFPIAVLISET
ncbi:MAG TPA: malto-oligosyltrehalose synthase [Chthoniobacterales bacterium]